MDGNPRSDSERARALTEWITLLERRGIGGTATEGLGRYAETDARKDPRERERFIADIMAPAARALLSTEGVWYQAALSGNAAPKRQACRVVRVAFGLFRTAEPGSMHRVTVYHVDPWDRTFVTAEPDGLFARHKGRTVSWDGRSPAARRPLKKRLEAAFDAASEWVSSNLPTANEARAFARWHGSELEELKRLYEFFHSSKEGSIQRLSKPDQTGYFASSSGYVEKFEEQLRRMIPVYRTFLLSAGEIRASLPAKYKKESNVEFSL